MTKILILVIVLCSVKPAFSQFSEEKIVTDSSEIKIVRNSAYKVLRETYKNKDSVFYSVRYIDDTTKLKIEGWERKNGDYFGNWVEYSPEGTWFYTINYDNDTWKYNKKEYPFQGLLDSMKKKADNIIIKKYGSEFFKHNISFKFHGHTYMGKWKTYDTDTFWMQDEYIGDWKEPIKIKPNSFILDYTIRFDNRHFYYDFLRINLDSTGNQIDQPDRFDIIFKERKEPKSDKFHLTYEKAIKICKRNGLVLDKWQELEATLRYGFRKKDIYAGQYYFEVAQQYDEKTTGDCSKNCLVTKYYNVWRLNPWTTGLFFNKKMKQETQWSRGCGVSGYYIELDK